MRVTKDIEVGEHMIYVPHHVLLSVQNTYQHEILGPILEVSPTIKKGDEACLILAMRLIYEKTLGDKSFWHDWIQVLPQYYHTYEWSFDEIEKC